MRTFIYFVVLLISAVLLQSCDVPVRNKEQIKVDNVDTVYNHVLTVYDVLDFREEWKYQIYLDSVYLTMPEQILTHILVTKGTELDTQEIVEDYLANKQFYHDTILNSMNIQKQYIPDSLPPKSKPNKPLNNSDTINKINNNR